VDISAIRHLHGYTFFYKNTVYKNIEAEIWYQNFQKMGNIRPLQRKVSQMKQQVKRSSLSVYLSGQSPTIGLEFKNISGSEKIKVFL